MWKLKIYFCYSQMHQQHRPLVCSSSSQLFPFHLSHFQNEEFNSEFSTIFHKTFLFSSCCFSLFSFPFWKSAQTLWHRANFPKFNPSGTKLRLTNWHRTSSLILAQRQKHSHRILPRETRAKRESCATRKFFLLFTHPISTLFYCSRATRYWKKVPFTASPTMQMYVVL